MELLQEVLLNLMLHFVEQIADSVVLHQRLLELPQLIGKLPHVNKGNRKRTLVGQELLLVLGVALQLRDLLSAFLPLRQNFFELLLIYEENLIDPGQKHRLFPNKSEKKQEFSRL